MSAAEQMATEELRWWAWAHPDGADLSYLLHDGQMELRQAWRAATGRKFVACIARRWGKSFWCCVESVELALRVPGAQIRYAAPTAKMVRSIIEPVMRVVLRDCPEPLRPHHSRQEGVWRYPNGSEVHVAGCDQGGADRLRGTATHLGIVDEAGFVADVEYVVGDVLLPQTLTTGGELLVVSTPATTPAHPFQQMCADAAASGAYAHRTIFDAPHIPRRLAEEYIEERGGIESTAARREYLAEHVVDEEGAIVPEFTREEPHIVQAVERPEHYDAYVVGDLGFVDLTVWLLGYYHFDMAVWVVERELVFRNASTGDMVPALKAAERELWGDKEPFIRIADAEPMVLREFTSGRNEQGEQHGYRVSKARNDELDAAVNGLRLATRKRGYRIHPSCKVTISHLRYGIWNRARTGFERMEGYGHFDGVAAAMYMERHVRRDRNPYPRLPPGVTLDTHWVPPPAPSDEERALVEHLRPRRRRR